MGKVYEKEVVSRWLGCCQVGIARSISTVGR